MRRKKERSKQDQTNKQGKATQHTQGSHFSHVQYTSKKTSHKRAVQRAPVLIKRGENGGRTGAPVRLPVRTGACIVYRTCTYIHVHVLCCFALFVCLTLLASFFLPSHLSFKNMYMYMEIHVHSNCPQT